MIRTTCSAVQFSLVSWAVLAVTALSLVLDTVSR